MHQTMLLCVLDSESNLRIRILEIGIHFDKKKLTWSHHVTLHQT